MEYIHVKDQFVLFTQPIHSLFNLLRASFVLIFYFSLGFCHCAIYHFIIYFCFISFVDRLAVDLLNRNLCSYHFFFRFLFVIIIILYISVWHVFREIKVCTMCPHIRLGYRCSVMAFGLVKLYKFRLNILRCHKIQTIISFDFKKSNLFSLSPV